MTNLELLFGHHRDFLSRTLNTSKANKIQEISVDSGAIRLFETGILRCIPHNPENNDHGLILSAGIHGNETAPIELLNKLVTSITNNHITFNRPLLIILGNPEAMRKGQRFIDFNLNRLFLGAYQAPKFHGMLEADRAERIEKAVADFNQQFQITEHLDLHTAIRASKFERFALCPFAYSEQTETPKKPCPHHLQLLEALGTKALLLQSTPSSTFSAHVAIRYHAESYTLELGKVMPFGENLLEKYNDVMTVLTGLINRIYPKKSERSIKQYAVCHEIIHSGKSFKLHISDNTPNFTVCPKDALIWEDKDHSYRVKSEQEYIVFPNPQVEPGQRAGLMIKRLFPNDLCQIT